MKIYKHTDSLMHYYYYYYYYYCCCCYYCEYSGEFLILCFTTLSQVKSKFTRAPPKCLKCLLYLLLLPFRNRSYSLC
jgi:hypothetical protein